MPDDAWAFWIMAAWTDQADRCSDMLASVNQLTTPRSVHRHDEASIAHREQPEAASPSWAEADRRMRGEGYPSSVRNPGPNHATMIHEPPACRAPASSGEPPAEASSRLGIDVGARLL